MSERKLVSIVMVDDVVTHPNADNLELAIVGGWQCCVRKDTMKKGDLAIYSEIDSLLPLDNPLFEFLRETGTSKVTVEDVEYARIKTIKLRKELSQGLLIPVNKKGYKLGDDLTDSLKVIKYDPEAFKAQAAEREGRARYKNPIIRFIANVNRFKLDESFPKFIPKTDQARVQNMSRVLREITEKDVDETFEVTGKLDGSSFTAYVKNFDVGVCSRNLSIQLKPVELSLGRSVGEWVRSFILSNRKVFTNFRIRIPKFVRLFYGSAPAHFKAAFEDLQIESRLKMYRERTKRNIAIQGELLAPNIQENFEGVTENTVRFFSVFDIDKQEYMLPKEAREVIQDLGLEYVPVMFEEYVLPKIDPVRSVLELADGPSMMNGKFREGLVFKSNDRDLSFKAISNQYLIKTDN